MCSLRPDLLTTPTPIMCISDFCCEELALVLFRKLFKRGGGGATGRIWILKGGGMMVNDMIKFHKCHLGGGVCLNVRVCAGFHTGFWEGGNPKVRC